MVVQVGLYKNEGLRDGEGEGPREQEGDRHSRRRQALGIEAYTGRQLLLHRGRPQDRRFDLVQSREEGDGRALQDHHEL